MHHDHVCNAFRVGGRRDATRVDPQTIHLDKATIHFGLSTLAQLAGT